MAGKVQVLERAEQREDRAWREAKAEEMRAVIDRFVEGDEGLSSLLFVWEDEKGIKKIWAVGQLSKAVFSCELVKQHLIQQFIDGEL